MRTQAIGNGSLRARIPAPFAAVMRALQLQGADATMLRSLSNEEWREVLPMMDRAHLTLPLAQQALSGLPCWVAEHLEKNLADTARHWERVRAAYREAAATLDAHGVEYLVLKGFTQAPDFTPRPELRWQGDIDFYVPRDHIPAAVRALQEIGYASCYAEDDYRDADHVPTLVRFGTWKWNGNVYDPEVPPAVEVHFCLWNDSVSSIAIREIEEFWERRRFRRLGDLTFPALHPVDHVGYFALHILRSVFSAESPVHHVRELATFLDRRAGDSDFWKEWSTLHSPRLRSMQAIACSLARAWFSCYIPGVLKTEIDSLPPQVRAWIETFGCVPLETLIRRGRDGRLLQFLLAETSEARRKILCKALAPGRIAGPAKVVSFATHPTTPARTNPIFTYFATYPAYLLSRIWMNGCAVLRLLAHAFLLFTPHARPGLKTSEVCRAGD
jgi:Uncharacterised nucleotidyltransferase